MPKILLTKDDIDTMKSGCGLVIGFEGFKENPSDAEGVHEQIYIEHWDGKIKVHVWNGKQDAQTLEIDPIVN